MSKPLNQITNELIVTNYQLELQQGEIDAMLENELITLQNELSTKVDHYRFRLEKLEYAVMFWELHEKEAKQVKKSIQNHIDRMEETIKDTMLRLESNELVGEKYKFKIRPSKPRLVIDELTLPMEFKMVETKYVPDKEKIRLALEAGQEIQGASFEQGQTLTVGVNK